MESTFNVRMTPNELIDILDTKKYKLKRYAFLGINTEGDFDPKKQSASEWDEFRSKKCLYNVTLRHGKLRSCLSGTFNSWAEVDKALEENKLRTTYTVTISVTLHDVVTVEAENLRDAEEIVRSKFENGELTVDDSTAKMINAKFDAILKPERGVA